MKKETITWSDFEKLDFRSGTIIEAEPLKNARKPAFVLTIDFGRDLGMKQSSAQITELYSIDQLVGMQVLAVVNLPPKQISNIMSDCLVCGFYTEKGVVLAQPNQVIANGSKLG